MAGGGKQGSGGSGSGSSGTGNKGVAAEAIRATPLPVRGDREPHYGPRRVGGMFVGPPERRPSVDTPLWSNAYASIARIRSHVASGAALFPGQTSSPEHERNMWLAQHPTGG